MKYFANTYFENLYWKNGIEFVAGIDEAGRGPLAGPVVAAAVIFPKNYDMEKLQDSKKLSQKSREMFYEKIYEAALSIGIGIIDHTKIDEINILEATKLAMKTAVSKLKIYPQQLLVDGNFFEHEKIPVKNIIQGDKNAQSIAAASIIAKVTRDSLMLEYDADFPQYGFAKHKGYGTKIHVEAIHKFGHSRIHRKTFHVPGL